MSTVVYVVLAFLHHKQGGRKPFEEEPFEREVDF
jgi:hypothetical protein